MFNFNISDGYGNHNKFLDYDFYNRNKDKNLITNGIEFFSKLNNYKLLEEISNYLKTTFNSDFRTTGTSSNVCHLESSNNNPLHLTIYFRLEDWLAEKDRSVYCDIIGSLESVKLIYEYFKSHYSSYKPPSVNWYYLNEERKVNSKSIVIEEPDKVLDCYYPYLNSGVDNYLDNYFNSSASILVLMGEPGTGKTSLIRYFIYKYSLNASICYDEEVIGKDGIFIDFLFNKEKDILVVEDADLILSNREDGGNKMMSRFLNISDGLIKLPKKKMLFTTNIRNVNNLDQALIRPGRCFDCVTFRTLNYEEALEVCEEGNLDLPKENKSYLLTDLFNPIKPKERTKRFGF